MSNDITLPGAAEIVETMQQPDGSHRQVVAIGDLGSHLESLVGALRDLPLAVDPTTGRLRVVLDATGGAQTLGTVTTVTTVSAVSAVNNVAQIGGFLASTQILDAMSLTWASMIRGRIT